MILTIGLSGVSLICFCVGLLLAFAGRSTRPRRDAAAAIVLMGGLVGLVTFAGFATGSVPHHKVLAVIDVVVFFANFLLFLAIVQASVRLADEKARRLRASRRGGEWSVDGNLAQGPWIGK